MRSVIAAASSAFLLAAAASPAQAFLDSGPVADFFNEFREQAIPRELLYLADEIFLTGTAAEITPVRSVDHIQIGAGKRGPITEALQSAFFGLFNGKTADKWGWLEPAETAKSRGVAAAG